MAAARTVNDIALRRLAAQAAATEALVRADTAQHALEMLLAGVGEALDCAFGACWRPSPTGDVLECVAHWVRQPGQFAGFVEASVTRRFGPRDGLPGRVWSSHGPVWVEDVVADASFPRVQAARAAGLHGGVAFPARAEGRLVAVVEFLWREPLAREDELLQLLDSLGVQVGQFVARKEVEAALAETEARFRIFADTAADAIFTTDQHSTILYANPAVERLFGYSPSELTGQNLSLLIPQRLRSRHHDGVSHHVATGERRIPWSGVELPGLHRDGHEVPLEISFGEFRQAGHHYFTGIVRDISDRVRARKLLERQRSDLEELTTELEETVEELHHQRDEAIESRTLADYANRAKSDFLMTMSHELRTPLNAIIGYADLLLAGIPESISPSVEHKVERIADASAHLLELIEEILAFTRLDARAEKLNVSDIVLATLLEEVQSLIEPLSRSKGLSLECVAPDPTITLCTDVRRLKQILLNLLGNAVKFTDDGEVRLTATHAGDDVVFAISDTGPGIEPDEIDAIFSPFYQTDRGTTRQVQGTGLGLTVSRKLAELLGGRLDVESEPGRGATFTLVVPRCSEP